VTAAASSKSKSAQQRNRQQLIVIGVIVAIAALAVIILIALSGQAGGPSGITYESVAQTRLADGGFILGSPDAPVTIVEFADFACPACQQYEPTITQFVERYVVTGQAKYEWRTFATAGGQQTVFLGNLLDCMADQNSGSIWLARERLFQLAMQGRYQDAPRIIATEQGQNYSDLLECSRSSTQTQTDMNVGQQLGVTGTPAVGIRYADGPVQWITYAGQQYNRGGVPLDVLSAVVQQANS
jgi:protein-disulfide isomerase